MAYQGNTPALSYTSFAVQHFTTSATTSYTLDHSVANENEIRLVINNVVQQPGSSYAYTASGTTLTLSAATSATDTMYAVFLGKAVQTVTPASGSVTNAMLGETITVANGGTGLTSGFKNGITMTDQWRIVGTTNTGTQGDVTTNWERNDSTGYGSIGTGLTESSGIFSFPQTGLYLIIYSFSIKVDTDTSAEMQLKITIDNSSYSSISEAFSGLSSGSGNQTCTNSLFINVTDISNIKFKFTTTSFATNTFILGNTNEQRSGFGILRIGDSV